MKVSRRDFLKLAMLAGIATEHSSFSIALQQSQAERSGYFGYDAAIVIDGCGGPGSQTSESFTALSQKLIDDVRNSGITSVNLTVGYVGNRPDLEAFVEICKSIAFWESEIRRKGNTFLKILNRDDLSAAKSSRRLGLIFGLQDGVAFQHDLDRLNTLHGLGIRIVQPTYNVRNLLGDGCMEPDNAGLSKAGHAAIERLNQLHILIDLSHCGRKTSSNAINASKDPVAFTHTGCAAIYDHPRNKTDEELRAVSEKGGVTGIYFMPYLRPAGQQTAEDVIRHLEHAIYVAGEDHVGIGTDLPISPLELTEEFVKAHKEDIARRKQLGISAPGEAGDVYLYVPDLNSPRKLETLANMLSKRGHRSAQIDKILGKNFQRLIGDVWSKS
jgi:membrane dipeptidase